MNSMQLSRKDGILLELIEKEGYISGGVLAKKFGVSERTIRKELKDIKITLEKKVCI